MLDLPAYLHRIGYAGPLQPTLAVLQDLHIAHATHVPFENLDIFLGHPIRLDLDSLQNKLVHGCRGGYCYEQNLLFAAVLRELGFELTMLAARVRYRSTRVLPRTHMTLLVRCEGDDWLADVGFGLEGLLLPVPFEREVRQYARTYRIAPENSYWVLQSLHDGAWLDVYVFSLEAQERVDYEVANHYMSTHPDSRFVQTLTVQMPSRAGRAMLRNRELMVDDGRSVVTRTLSGDEELLKVLGETFGLHFPADTRFRAPGVSG